MQIGDLISFGKYEWRVLDIGDKAALVITTEVIEKRVYHNSLVPITWAECDMRKYLNGEFYDKFTEDEKSKIIAVTNETQTTLGLTHMVGKIQRITFSI